MRKLSYLIAFLLALAAPNAHALNVVAGSPMPSFSIYGYTGNSSSVFKQLFGSATSANTFSTANDATGASYQVPTGKKFVALAVFVQTSGSGGTMIPTIGPSTAAASNSGQAAAPTGWVPIYTGGLTSGNGTFSAEVEFAAGKYVSFQQGGGSTMNALAYVVYGVEVSP